VTGTGGVPPRLVTPRRRPGVRARSTARRSLPSRILSGPLVRILHRSAPSPSVASIAVGPFGPAVTGPLPLDKDEEYVGATARLLLPLLLASVALVGASGWIWERRKDRRVADARLALTSRIHRLRHQPSENAS